MDKLKIEQIIISLFDDAQLENYDNYRDCWNGALLKAIMTLKAQPQDSEDVHCPNCDEVMIMGVCELGCGYIGPPEEHL